MPRTHRSLWLCTSGRLGRCHSGPPPPAHAGVRVAIGVGVPVSPAPVVVAPPPAVVYPAPVVVAPPPVVYEGPPSLRRGYYRHPYRHWGHHHWRRWLRIAERSARLGVMESALLPLERRRPPCRVGRAGRFFCLPHLV